MTKKIKKFTAEKKILGSKTTIYLSIGLHKGRPSYRRSLQSSKENIQHFKTWNFVFFSIFVGHFCPPGPRSGSTDWPDWIRIQSLPTILYIFTFSLVVSLKVSILARIPKMRGTMVSEPSSALTVQGLIRFYRYCFRIADFVPDRAGLDTERY